MGPYQQDVFGSHFHIFLLLLLEQYNTEASPAFEEKYRKDFAGKTQDENYLPVQCEGPVHCSIVQCFQVPNRMKIWQPFVNCRLHHMKKIFLEKYQSKD